MRWVFNVIVCFEQAQFSVWNLLGYNAPIQHRFYWPHCAYARYAKAVLSTVSSQRVSHRLRNASTFRAHSRVSSVRSMTLLLYWCSFLSVILGTNVSSCVIQFYRERRYMHWKHFSRCLKYTSFLYFLAVVVIVELSSIFCSSLYKFGISEVILPSIVTSLQCSSCLKNLF